MLRNATSIIKQKLARFRKQHRKTYNTLLTLSISAVVVLVAVTSFVASIGMGAFGKIPTNEELIDIQNPVGSEILAADATLIGKYYIEDRLFIDLEAISPAVIDALVATEDARFFRHTGVDMRSWMRVFFKTILMKDRTSGGGSTLSQQLAKNLYPRHSYDYFPLVINKLREVFIARKMESLYTKKELLQLYLNTVSFSGNTYGIRVASKRYFNKMPKELKPEEAACLIAMLKATAMYDPLKHPNAAKARRNLVLEQMFRYNYLKLTEKDSLQALPLTLDYSPATHNDGLATYFRETLRLELNDWLTAYNKENRTNYDLYTDGLRIYTTINTRMQQMAEQAVETHLSSLQADFDKHWENHDRPWEDERLLNLAREQSDRYKILRARELSEKAIDSIFNEPITMNVFDWEKKEREVKMSPMDSIRYYFKMLNAGFMAMEPQTGYVRAWVGGTDYHYFKYDHVRSRRQVGSTFKPLVYAAAIKKGIHPCSYIGNYLRTYSRYENWQPKNADHRYGGYYSMEGALSKSINAITVSLIMRTSPDSVATLANAMGIQSEILPVPAIALGAVDVSLEDMTTVYSTLANRGRRAQPIYLMRIEDRDGKVLLSNEQPQQSADNQTLTQDEADIMNEMLQTTVDRGTGVRLRYRYKFDTPLAGKTGTSQNHSDGWFMGYTPALVTGTWVGAESPTVYFRDLSLGQGANTALPVFAEFWKQLLAEEQFDRYTKVEFAEPSVKVRSMLNCSSYVASDSLYNDIVEKVKAAEEMTQVETADSEAAAKLVAKIE